jgi:hypothetical protein
MGPFSYTIVHTKDSKKSTALRKKRQARVIAVTGMGSSFAAQSILLSPLTFESWEFADADDEFAGEIAGN